MPGLFRAKSTGFAIAVLIFLPLLCGLVFLVDHAPRDWSLHWKKPLTLLAATSSTDYALAATPVGWDALWSDPSGHMKLSSFDRSGHQLRPDVALRGSPQSLTLGYAGAMDVAAWRQDTGNGSQLRSAVVMPGRAPVYHTLASGSFALEHPQAFTAGSSVDVVFSWQRQQYDVYLSRISGGGTPVVPVQLTHVASYAFNPHAIVDTQGNIQLMYMDQCCGSAAFRMMSARFSREGRLLGAPQRLDLIQNVGARGTGATPEQWGLDLQRLGSQVWAAWAGDRGLSVAIWQRGRLTGAPQVAIPGTPAPILKLALTGAHRNIVWQMLGSNSNVLEAAELGPNGIPTANPDRIAFEAASNESPVTISAGGVPAIVFLSTPSKSSTSTLELAAFSPAAIGAPNVWSKLGLGLANPIGSLAVLLVTSVAFAVLLAMGNILLVFAFVVIYLIAFRVIPLKWKWYAYTGLLALGLYGIFVSLGAPSPPVLFLGNLSPTLGLVAACGLALFVAVLTRTFLSRVEDIYRAGAMAFAAFYFIAFLQALTIVQGGIGSA